jgi:hypothetical protein
MPISFGDNVRVLPSPATEAAGVAGRVGNVFGETMPSSSGVTVIGAAEEDFALNVFFEELNKGFWFAENLLELLDHAPGTTIKLDGVPKQWVRAESGEWLESTAAASPSLWQRFTARFRRNA